MAYNPFNIFRRNQRAIFAVVTVFIMFTFVLSSGLSGGADFFDWFPRWLGSKGKRGDAVATIDGSRVYQRDVDALRRQRMMAGRYMQAAAVESLGGLRRSLRDLAGKGTPELAGLYQSVLASPEPNQFLAFLPGYIRSNAKANAADKEAADVLDAMTGVYMALNLDRAAGTYFAGVPNRTGRDAIEFMLWDKKAKDLGVGYTDDDVRALVDAEFRGQFQGEAEVVQRLRKDLPGFTLDACLKALAAEFRVRTARTALLGTIDGGRGDRTRAAGPLFAPAYDLFDFYRDKTSPTRYEVLAVPAAAFTAAVPGVPTDDELRRLFEERKDAEPDPAKEEPGFREPRKVKVEWASATGEEPYYQAKARAALEAAEQYGTSAVVRGLLVPTPGVGAAWAVEAAAPAALTEPLVYARYKSEADRHRTMTAYRWGGVSSLVLPQDLLDTSVVQPKVLAAAAGGLGSPLSTTSLAYTAAVAAEQRGRVKAGLPLVLAGVPGIGQLARVVGAEAEYRAALPDPLPIGALKPALVKELAEAKARELALADLRSLKDEVAKITNNGKAKNKEGEAKAYVAQFVKDRGLKSGASADLQSEWTIGDDPGLAPLKAVLEKGAGLGPHGALPVAFGKRFFYAEDPMTGARTAATGTYRPELYPERPEGGLRADPMFVAWRTEEKPAESPKSFTAARDKVVAAWKRLKARDLAKAEAERIAAEVTGSPDTSAGQIAQRLKDIQAQLRAKAGPDPKAQEAVKQFPVLEVGEFQVGPDLTMGGAGSTLRPFRLTPSADLPYPTPELQKALLEKRAEPVKTVFVLPDAPKDTYYVAVLADRRERSPLEFQSAMFLGGLGGLGGQGGGLKEGVTLAFRQDAARKAQESVLALLKKEYRYEETPEQKKKLEEGDKNDF